MAYQKASSAREAATSGQPQAEVHRLFRDAYAQWANVLEDEVVVAAGLSIEPRKRRRRGRFPKVKEVLVVHSVARACGI